MPDKSQIDKSKEALERAFQKLGKKGIAEIIAKVKAMNIGGPTVEQYFLEFERHFSSIANNSETYALMEVKGNSRANLLYSIIVLDEDDLSGCDTVFYGGDNEDEVAEYLKQDYPEKTNMDFVFKIVGKRESDENDI